MGIAIPIGSDQLELLFAGTDDEMRKIGAFAIITQAIALPIHAWVAMVNMLCVGLGNAKGAFWLATARQGTCFIPFVHIMATLLGAYGVASVQALADVLTLALAIPISMQMIKKIKAAQAAAITPQT